MSNYCPTRREILKGAGSAIAATTAIPTASATKTIDVTDRRVVYDIKVTRGLPNGQSYTREQTVIANIISEQGDWVTIETEIKGHNAQTLRGEFPRSVFRRKIRGPTSRNGQTITFNRQSRSDDGRRQQIHGRVENGFFVKTVSYLDTEDGGWLRIKIKADQIEGPGAKSNDEAIVLLPRFISPEVHAEAVANTDGESTSITASEVTDSPSQDTVTAQSTTTRYAYSKLTTKDNDEFKILTSESDFTASGTYSSTQGRYTGASGSWTHNTSINWYLRYDSVTTSLYTDRAVVDGTGAYHGNFPWGTYVDWRSYHYHTHTIRNNGHNTKLRGYLEKKKFGEWNSWEFHKNQTFYDGSALYSTGSRQNALWYIVNII